MYMQKMNILYDSTATAGICWDFLKVKVDLKVNEGDFISKKFFSIKKKTS